MGILKWYESTNSNIEMTEENCDKTDKVPNSYHVTYWELGSLGYSIISHLIDVGFDIYITYSYFEDRNYSYFAWSLALTLFPSLIIALVSIRMYVEDIKDSASYKHSLVRIVLCLLGLILQSAPLIRNCDSLFYAIRSLKAARNSNRKQQEKYYSKMLNEDSDVALLRVFEAYLESAPQQVLQITLLLVDYSQGRSNHTIKQIISITIGFLSMGWCMANYNRCIRFDQENKKNISALGIAVQFFWHLNFTSKKFLLIIISCCTVLGIIPGSNCNAFTVSRILAISAVATLYTMWTLIAIVIHWCTMSTWLAVTSKTNFCGKYKVFEVFFSCTFGIIYIFNFLNLKDGPTKNYYLIFFLLCAVENIIAATIWGINAYSYFKNWVYYIFTVFPVVCFIFSSVFIIVYYTFLHPNRLKSGISSDKNSFYDKIMPSNAHEQDVTLTHEIES